MSSKRQLQVSELIKRNFSIVLQEQGRYIYKDVLVSVTQVAVTPDLSLAKIYLSVYGSEDKESIIDMINEHTHLLKQGLAHRIKKQIRRIPDVAFYIDETIDEIYRIDELLQGIRKPD